MRVLLARHRDRRRRPVPQPQGRLAPPVLRPGLPTGRLPPSPRRRPRVDSIPAIRRPRQQPSGRRGGGASRRLITQRDGWPQAGGSVFNRWKGVSFRPALTATTAELLHRHGPGPDHRPTQPVALVQPRTRWAGRGAQQGLQASFNSAVASLRGATTPENDMAAPDVRIIDTSAGQAPVRDTGGEGHKCVCPPAAGRPRSVRSSHAAPRRAGLPLRGTGAAARWPCWRCVQTWT